MGKCTGLVLYVAMNLVMEESVGINTSMDLDMSYDTYVGKEMDMANINLGPSVCISMGKNNHSYLDMYINLILEWT